MKKVLIYLVLAVSFAACQKEELLSNKVENKLVGTWQMVEKTYNGEVEDISDKTTLLVFYNNQAEYSTEGHFVQTIIKYDQYEEVQDAKYWVYEKGSILSINGADAEITKLTKNKLAFRAVAGTEILAYEYERLKD